MRFWDSSAIVPLLVGEAASTSVLTEHAADPDIMVWWATPVECVSALTRLERDRRLKTRNLTVALDRLDALIRGWHEIQPVERVRQAANRLLRVHDLRAADALQLGAAVVASEDQPASLVIVTLDDRLARAAEREGFRLVVPSAG
jgi:predicted nucleic acid-binding protein